MPCAPRGVDAGRGTCGRPSRQPVGRQHARAPGAPTRPAPSSSASAHACKPPAPPNATSAKSRGSSPRCTLISRSARTISVSATRTTPSAAAAHPTRAGVPPVSAARDRSRRSEATAEPPAVGQQPSRRFASVTVGSSPPTPVARRPWLGAGRVRSRPGARRLRRPTRWTRPRPHRVHVHHREPSGTPATHRLVVSHPPVHDRRDIGGRAAHVEGEQVVEPAGTRHPRRAHDAAGRPGQHERRGAPRRCLSRPPRPTTA